jgi:cyclohexadienyl dehydratase
MLSIVRAIVAGFAVAAATVPALAQQQKSLLHEISERGVLRVGTTGTYFPFSIRDAATNSYKGFDIEVAERIAKDLGVKVEFVQTTWPALVAGLVARKYDIGASGVTITLERLKSVAFTDHYIRPAVVPIIRAADKSKYGKWQDLDKEGIRIAVILGTSSETTAKAKFKKATIVSVEPPAQEFQEVMARRADAGINDTLSYARVVKRAPELAMLDPDNPIEGSFDGLMTVQGDQVWLNWLNTWIKFRQADGFFAQLEAKWIVGGGE